MFQPLISIIVPVYNGKKYIEKTVETFIAQTYENFELLLINDGSTDDSLLIIEGLAKKDKRIRVLDKPNGGIAHARNFGINLSQGEFVAFCDQDDFWLPTKLEKQVPLLEQSKVGLVYSWAMKEFTHPVNNRITVEKHNGRNQVFKSLVLENLIPTCSVIVRKSLLEQVGFFDEQKDLMGVDDWNLWLRLSLITEFDFVEEALSIHVFHGSNYSSNNAIMHKAELVCLIELRKFVEKNQILLKEDWPLIERKINLRYFKDYLYEGSYDLAAKALIDVHTSESNYKLLTKAYMLKATPNFALRWLQKIKRMTK